MTIHGELTLEDCREARRIDLWSYLIPWFWTIPLCLILICFAPTVHDPINWFLIAFLSLAFVIRLAAYLVVRSATPRAIPKFLLGLDNTPGPRDLELTPEGINLSGPYGFHQIQWNDNYRRYKASPDFALVYEPSGFRIFPRRWFTEEQYAEFQHYLREGLAQRPWFWIK